MKNSNTRLHGKVAVVTGASRGIGKAIALALAGEGADVAICSRSQQLLEATGLEIEPLAVKSFAKVCDVSRPEDLDDFIRGAAEFLGPIDILINNAGIYATEPLAEHSLETWRAVLDVNLNAAMWASKISLSYMMESGWGRIVNISSISGKSGEPYGAAYSASKAALLGLTQSLALETARHNITVNAVCPGWVQTEMAVSQLTNERWCQLSGIPKEDSIEIAVLSIPQRRFIEPGEIASLVTFLCSEEARSITGQAINMCGGLSLH